MTATVHDIRPVEPDPLAELRTERANIEAEFQRFSVVDKRLAGAAAKIAEIDAALVDLDRSDRQAIETWAETAEGDPPVPLLDERKALMARRLDAEANRRAAEIAIAAVEEKRIALIREMNRIGLRIRERQFAAALDEGRRIHAEALSLASDIAAKLQEIMGMRQAIFTMMVAASNKHDADQMGPFQGAIAEIDAFRRPEMLADPKTVEAHAKRWLEVLR